MRSSCSLHVQHQRAQFRRTAFLTRVAGTAIRNGQIKPTKVHGEKPWTFAKQWRRIRQTRGTAFRVHKASWKPLIGAVVIRGPWLWIGLFYGSREWATYFRMPPCLKNATSMSFSKRAVTLKLFPVLVWKQRQTWTLDKNMYVQANCSLIKSRTWIQIWIHKLYILVIVY